MLGSAMCRLKCSLLVMVLLTAVVSSQAQAKSSVSSCHLFSVGRSDFRLRVSQVKRASAMPCSLVRRLIRSTYTGGGYRQTYPYHTSSGVGYGEPIHWFHGGWRCSTGAGGVACLNATRPIFNVIDIGAPKMQAITAATRFKRGRVEINKPGHSGYTNCGNPPNWSGVLRALHLGCGQARRVFRNISCSDPECVEIHSHDWSCHRHSVGSYQARGVCSKGNKRVRWKVYE